MRRIGSVLVVPLFIAACGAGTTGTSAGGATVSAAASLPAAAPASSGEASARAREGTGLGERRNGGGGVEVVATWNAGDPLSLELALDTHSVDLDRFDLATATKLRLDGGDWAAPTRADVPKGGHHRAGTVTFGSVSPAAFASARLIELRIVDVGVAERLLSWERAR